MRRVLAPVLLAALAVTIIATPALAQFGFPEGANERAEVMRSIYNRIMMVAVIVFAFVMGWLLVVLVRFRRGGKGRRTNEAHRGHTGAEVTWTIIPAIIMIWVGWISYQGMIVLDFDQPEPEMEIGVTGFQWFWKADYGNDVTIGAQPGPEGQLDDVEPFLFPADTPVLLNVTAGDVIHALWIPELGVKLDAVPGRANYVWVEAPEGEYFTQCAEYCGLAHAYMRALFKAVPQDEFDAWLSEKASEATRGELGRTAEVNVTAGGIEPQRISAIAGAKLFLKINNRGESPMTAAIEGVDNETEVPAGGTAWLNTTLAAGEHTLTIGADTATIAAVEAEIIRVELSDFAIQPDAYDLEVGKIYVFQIANVGQAPHNFFVGDYASKETLWESRTLDPGASTSLLIEPGEGQAGTHDVWCNIPGHYQLGMSGSLTIG